MKRKLIPTLVLGLTFSLATPVQAVTPVSQPIDLTYAAEKAVNSVVYIKVTTNGKTQIFRSL